MFKRLLIANRGEIALRVARACRELDIDPVMVYSEADRDALHVQLAAHAYCIGPAPAQQSYLNGDAILTVAKAAGCDAIHPGYGFLSENAAFAQECVDEGFAPNEPVDVARVMLMCLLHDVVEIDAGDTYAYDTDGLKTQKAREDAAKQRIYSLLPDDQKRGLMAVFDEFEADETAEAHFAHAMDNLQPLLLNNSNGGSDWADHDVTAKQVYGRQSRTEKGSAYLYQLTDNILQANIKKGALKEK